MMVKKSWYNTTYGGVVILSLVWLGIMLFIRPLTPFPLNDDWSYILTVKALVEEGQLVFNDWMAGPILTSTFWGALFCLPAGFSVEALKAGTLVLGFAGIILAFLTVRQVTSDARLALATGILIAVNPLYINLSATFMTDVQFFAFFMAAVYFQVLYLKNQRTAFLLAAFFFALLSTFIRQFGLIVPLSFAIYELLSSRTILKKGFLVQMISFVLILGAYQLFIYWLEWNEQTPSNYRNISDVFTVTAADFGWRIFIRMGLILHEAGFWLLPLILFLLFRTKNELRKKWKLPVILLAIFLVPMIRMISAWPSGNVMYDLGLGPITTRDIFIDKLPAEGFGVPWLWNLVRPFAFVGATGLVLLTGLRLQELWMNFRESSGNSTTFHRSISMAALIMIFFYLGITMINFTYFDRYIIPLLILVPLFLLSPQKAGVSLRFRIFFVSFALILMIFGVMSTRFYLEWNRARWQLADELVATGADPKEIDGGHEYNGWHGTEIITYGHWKTSDYKYIISFSVLDGTNTIRDRQLIHPLLRNEIRIYALEVIDTDGPSFE